MSNMDLAITFGGDVKSVAQNRAGGYGVFFSDVLSPDTQGEYFTAKTSFWLEDRKTVPVLYSHALDQTLGKQRLGDATFKQDETGIWFEFQLEQRNKYVARIMELIKKGVLGFSTGAWAPLTERVEASKGLATWIKQWPIFELSLTPTPAEPRTQAIALKHYRAIGLDEMDRRSRLSAAERMREESDRLGEMAQEVLTGNSVDRWTEDQLQLNGRSRVRALSLTEVKLKEAQLDQMLKEAESLVNEMRGKAARDNESRLSPWRHEGVRNGHLLNRRH